MASTSLVILDLKEIDPEKHRQLTGRDNANILAMARHISDLGVPLWIRHVLVPGLTDDEEGLRRTADFIRSLKTVQRVEALPYHTGAVQVAEAGHLLSPARCCSPHGGTGPPGGGTAGSG